MNKVTVCTGITIVFCSKEKQMNKDSLYNGACYCCKQYLKGFIDV